MPNNPWSAEVYSTQEQKVPHTFSHTTKSDLRNNIYDWLVSTRPTYLASGTNMLYKEDSFWMILSDKKHSVRKPSKGKPTGKQRDEGIYRMFCEKYLNLQYYVAKQEEIQRKEQQKRSIQQRMQRAQIARTSMKCIYVVFLIATIFFGIFLIAPPVLLTWTAILLTLYGLAPALERYDRETERRWYWWLKTYGVETVATVQYVRVEGKQPKYVRKFVWSHPMTGESHTISPKEHFSFNVSDQVQSTCQLDSTHPVLIDPLDAKNVQVYFFLKNDKHCAFASSINCEAPSNKAHRNTSKVTKDSAVDYREQHVTEETAVQKTR